MCAFLFCIFFLNLFAREYDRAPIRGLTPQNARSSQGKATKSCELGTPSRSLLWVVRAQPPGPPPVRCHGVPQQAAGIGDGVGPQPM